MKYSGHRKLLCELSKLSKFNALWIQNEHWGIFSYLQIPPRENWFQYVRRVYATAINFPCITTLDLLTKNCLNKVQVSLGSPIYLKIKNILDLGTVRELKQSGLPVLPNMELEIIKNIWNFFQYCLNYKSDSQDGCKH